MNKNNMNAVPLNTTTLNTRLLNTTRLNTNGFPMLSKRGGSSADISQAITDSLVCWYDIGKQQCTNESMAANPVLADLSGNGHDIECFNFGWSGMSGIGGYNTNFNTWNKQLDCVVNDHKLIIRDYFESTPDVAIIYDNSQSEYTMQFKVQGITDSGLRLELGQGSIVESDSSIKQDGIYTRNKLSNNIAGFKLYGQKPANGINITIELLPEYPNALVSDGVDDYCYTNGLPMLTDYTVIAKRKWIGFTNNCAVASKMKNDGNTNGAFCLEHIGTGQEKEYWNFGENNRKVLFPEEITYGTPTSYNGNSIRKGDLPDNDVLSLFSTRENLQVAGQIALYSFLLFDRTLTTAEIEWVKKNMIESGGGVENGLE